MSEIINKSIRGLRPRAHLYTSERMNRFLDIEAAVGEESEESESEQENIERDYRGAYATVPHVLCFEQ